MKSFIQKYEKDVMGSLSGFDRLVFRGTLRRLSFREGMASYLWSVYQSEWATDILFKDPDKLGQIYPHFLRHGLATFASPDVMRFLGRKIPPRGDIPPAFAGEVITHLKKRPEGIRIKHWVGSNHIKLYDKQGSNLRVETTINNPRDFKVFRPKEGDPQGGLAWRQMRKGVDDLHRPAPRSPKRPTSVIWRPWPVPTTLPPWAHSRRNCAGPLTGRENGCGP